MSLSAQYTLSVGYQLFASFPKESLQLSVGARDATEAQEKAHLFIRSFKTYLLGSIIHQAWYQKWEYKSQSSGSVCFLSQRR